MTLGEPSRNGEGKRAGYNRAEQDRQDTFHNMKKLENRDFKIFILCILHIPVYFDFTVIP